MWSVNVLPERTTHLGSRSFRPMLENAAEVAQQDQRGGQGSSDHSGRLRAASQVKESSRGLALSLESSAVQRRVFFKWKIGKRVAILRHGTHLVDDPIARHTSHMSVHTPDKSVLCDVRREGRAYALRRWSRRHVSITTGMSQHAHRSVNHSRLHDRRIIDRSSVRRLSFG